MMLHHRYAECGTEIGYAATLLLREVRYCYAECGTEVAYGATRSAVWWYAECGTEIEYGATSGWQRLEAIRHSK
eukprot:721124-Rhodomonas_salina.1